MSFFKYLGEFFLFRWFWRLFSGSHREGHSDLDDIDADLMGGHYDGEYDNRGQSFDDFMEEQDDWDMMEDGF